MPITIGAVICVRERAPHAGASDSGLQPTPTGVSSELPASNPDPMRERAAHRGAEILDTTQARIPFSKRGEGGKDGYEIGRLGVHRRRIWDEKCRGCSMERAAVNLFFPV